MSYPQAIVDNFFVETGEKPYNPHKHCVFAKKVIHRVIHRFSKNLWINNSTLLVQNEL